MTKHKEDMKFIETYKGIRIYLDNDGLFTTVQTVPVIGSLQTGHKTLEAAKKYIDQTPA